MMEIRVSATTSCAALAGSIVAAFSDGGDIALAAIGPVPVNTAVKAVCIANRTLAARGVVLALVPELTTRSLTDRTAPTTERPWVITLMRLVNVFGAVKDV